MGVAIYKLARGNEAQAAIFMVENTADGEPRRGANDILELGLTPSGTLSADSRGRLASAAQSIEDELNTVALLASTMLNSMKKVSPSEITLEFGVVLGGKCGIPLLTEGSAKANLKVQLKWQAGKSKMPPSSRSDK